MADNDIFTSLRQMAEEKMAKIPAAPAQPASASTAAPSGAGRIADLLKAGQPPRDESAAADTGADRQP